MWWQRYNKKHMFWLFWALFWVVAYIVVSKYSMSTGASQSDTVFNSFEEISTERAIDLVLSKEASNIGKDKNNVYILDKDGKGYKAEMDREIIGCATLNGLYIADMSVMTLETKTNNGVIVIYIAVTLTLALLVYRRIKFKKITNTENSEEKVDVPIVKFDDIYGVEGLKNDILRVVDYLKDTEKYAEIGARAPKGIILYGPPGTGKTLLAKAIAGEAGVPFFAASGSDFAEKYVGVGAKRVRELYDKARQNSPSIVFIDEVDAIAGRRTDETNTEDIRTLNALLAELDGFNSSDGIVTICATNRLDILDSAFQRAGRFDLKLAVSLPDREARLGILDIHSKNKKLSALVKLKEIARRTQGFSGADLEALMNEAALTAAFTGHKEIDNEDIDEAFYKIILQGNKTKKQEKEEARALTAWHEAGHALATKLLTNDSVDHISIIGSTSGAAGFTVRTASEDGMQTRKYIKSLIEVMLAGRAAEEVYTGDPDLITTGASNDIERATDLARGYIEKYGMGKLGLVNTTKFGNGDKGEVLKEVGELNNDLYNSVLSLMRSNKDCLEEIAEHLIENETMNETELDSIIAKHSIKR